MAHGGALQTVRSSRSRGPALVMVVVAFAFAAASAPIFAIWSAPSAWNPEAAGTHRRCPRTTRPAEAEDKAVGSGQGILGVDWGQRTGYSNERPLPGNAELVGSTIWFEVELKKPLGIRLEDGPQGSGTGTGVGDVNDQGSAHQLLMEAINGKPIMWVQEGDALVAVNGEPTDGSTDKATQLVMEGGETVKLTFARPQRGNVKVVFPDGRQRTAPRGTRLSRIAEAVGYDSGCTSQDGRSPSCWFKDKLTGETYCLPLAVPGIVPSAFVRAQEQGTDPNDAQYECWVPLQLVPAPEAYEAELAKEAEIRARNAALRGNDVE